MLLLNILRAFDLREKELYNPVNVNKELYNPTTLRY
jgi:hypothetical protein